MKIKKEKKALTQGKAMHPFIPLLVMVVLCTIISYFVVPGAYDRETVDGVTRVVADSYHAVERTPVSLFNRPLRKFCVSDFRQKQEYHMYAVHDEAYSPCLPLSREDGTVCAPLAA